MFRFISSLFPARKDNWTIIPEYQQSPLAEALKSFEDAYQCQGEFITRSSLSQVYKIRIADKNFYLKKYEKPEKKIQQFLGQSKIRTEWQNLLWFREVKIPVAKVVAYGQETIAWLPYRGVLITEELLNTTDLVDIAANYPQLLKQHSWVREVSHQIAQAARLMHQQGFAHNDFKWRNILVDIKADVPQIYLIDCPSGMKWYKPFLEYRIIKDLACLDKRAKYELSRTQRLAFYKDYAQCQKLSPRDKKRLRKIIRFFHNRE